MKSYYQFWRNHSYCQLKLYLSESAHGLCYPQAHSLPHDNFQTMMRPQASSVTSNFIKRQPWKTPYLALYFQSQVQGISRQSPDLLLIILFSFHKILLLSGYLELSLFSKNWNSQRARTLRVSWGVGTSPAAAKATVPENSTVITSHGYQVGSFYFRKFDDAIGTQSANFKLEPWKCDIPNEKQITEMVATAS